MCQSFSKPHKQILQLSLLLSVLRIVLGGSSPLQRPDLTASLAFGLCLSAGLLGIASRAVLYA